MKGIVGGLVLLMAACGLAACGGFEHRSLGAVDKASALVSRQLLARANEPGLDLSSYLVRTQDAVTELTAELSQMQTADRPGDEDKKKLVVEFLTRARSVIRTHTDQLNAGIKVTLTQRRLLTAESVWPLQTDPEVKKQAYQRFQEAKSEHEQALRDGFHQASAMSMHCELLLLADDAVKAAFGKAKGLDAQTREYMKKFL